MLTEVAKRVGAIRTQLGLDQAEFAKIVFPLHHPKTAEGIIRGIESGDVKPSDSTCKRIDECRSWLHGVRTD